MVPFFSWREATEHIKESGILAYPTDTVWGLGCRADDRDLVARCLALKGAGRPQTASVIVAPESLEDLVYADTAARWHRFLPGPYTLIFPLRDKNYAHLAGPGPSLGCRIPALPPVIDLVREVGAPLVTTSLNFHGQPPAEVLTDAAQIARCWQIPIVEHATPCSKASTVLKWTGQDWQCLRLGAGPFSKG